MKKQYIFLAIFVVSFLMVFAGDPIKILRIYHNGTVITIPLNDIESITHSKCNGNGNMLTEYISIVKTPDSTYHFPINEIDSVDIETSMNYDDFYIKVTGEITEYMATHEDATIEDIQEQLKKYPSSIASEVKNNILYVYIDGYEYICDPYNVMGPIQSDEENDYDETYLEELIKDIDNALYPNEGIYDARLESPEESPLFARNTNRVASGNSIVMNKGNFLAWDPWEQIKFNTIKASNPKTYAGDFATLSTLKDFSQFNIVLLICHGTESGCLAVPKKESYLKELAAKGMMPYKKTVDKSTGKVIRESGDFSEGNNEIILKESALRAFLPSDLSNTILWTVMCCSDVDGSKLKKIAEERHVAAYAGANGLVYLDGILQKWCKSFVELFYDEKRPMSAGNAAMNVICNSKEQAKNPVQCKVLKPKDYIYSFYFYDNTIIYKPYVTAMEAVNNQPVASITMPYDLANAVMASRKRAMSASTITAGFWFKNKNTNKETELEINKSTTTLHNRFDYEKIVSRVELLGDTKDLEPGTYEYRTYLEIDGEKSYSQDIFEFTKGDNLCPDNHHPHMIDLGLPSGTKWSCCNVGAKKPEEYGGFYAWGETETKSVYSLDTYTCLAERVGMFSYTSSIPEDIQGTSYDAARVNMGEPWCMPSDSQIKELIKKCKKNWTTYNGVNGTIVKGPNGGCIFVPAPGFCNEKGISEKDKDKHGYYWSSSSKYTGSSWHDPHKLYIGMGGWSFGGDFGTLPYVGLSVRAVCCDNQDNSETGE